MTLWIFSHSSFYKDRVYGAFRVVRETKTRWYFEHVAGAFNYRDEWWLEKSMADLRCIAKVPDVETFEAVIASHAEMEADVKELRTQCESSVARVKECYNARIHNMVVRDEPTN